MGPLDQVLLLAAELKNTLKQDLDMDLNLPQFICYFRDNSVSIAEARRAFDLAIQTNSLLSDLADHQEYACLVMMHGLKISSTKRLGLSL